MSTGESSSPVSALVRVRAIPKAGTAIEIQADTEQRKALARLHGLQGVASYTVSLRAMNWNQDSVRLTGKVMAEITQQCVVTLEPVEATIDEEIDLILVPERSDLDPFAIRGGELTLEAEGPDEPDTFSGETIDAGAIAEEYFSLAIDPYPRIEGAALRGKQSGDGEIDPTNPFAGLAAWKRGR